MDQHIASLHKPQMIEGLFGRTVTRRSVCVFVQFWIIVHAMEVHRELLRKSPIADIWANFTYHVSCFRHRKSKSYEMDVFKEDKANQKRTTCLLLLRGPVLGEQCRAEHGYVLLCTKRRSIQSSQTLPQRALQSSTCTRHTAWASHFFQTLSG